jgi:hypothetical protein
MNTLILLVEDCLNACVVTPPDFPRIIEPAKCLGVFRAGIYRQLAGCVSRSVCI